jgi:hypothetical protein
VRRRDFFEYAVAWAASAGIAGCASPDSVKIARGSGIRRTYKESYDSVFGAAMRAAAKRKLEIVSSDRASGAIVLANGASMTSLGERIGVFVTRLGDRATSVEVVTQAVLPGVTFPPDWASLLFGEIEEELTAARIGQ